MSQCAGWLQGRSRLDVDRLQRLAGGLSDFTVSGLTVDSGVRGLVLPCPSS